ncbi:hypothetical protein BDZ90DRAFT_279466 [Jaminaea rosea]|uniref:Trafficking protein particle complex subunit 2-like protein n=1 Tax=Jaminaea rosea TaxID=1569628 RepID=A0A316UQV4_9BASI|nr:hypothetical protein BDZ90DRAFT_279466 [Jaminaea rosea]PWN27687.1 hypothetical protein BDZ90DRAFT_279466 [Jaminaea rosea]
MATTKIRCLAVISASNAPLYLRSFGQKDTQQADLRFHFIAHGALDIVEERAGNRASEQYLGLLLTLEDVAVYGFQTSTRVKFLVMITISDAIVRDLDLITIFRAMHTSYLSHICNPFHSLPQPLLPSKSNIPPPPPSEASLAASRKPIRSPLFERRMEKIAGWRSPDDAAPRPPPKPAAEAAQLPAVPPPPAPKA